LKIQMELRAEGKEISISGLCRILGVPRSSFYYSPRRRRKCRIDRGLAKRVWQVIQESPAYGYVKVWAVLRFRLKLLVNRKKVARIMRLMGWTLRQRRPRMRPRVRGSRSVAKHSNQRWATDITHIYCGQDGWCHMP